MDKTVLGALYKMINQTLQNPNTEKTDKKKTKKSKKFKKKQ